MKAQILKRAIASAGIVALLAMLLPSAAWAQDKPWYVAAGLGASFVNDVDSTDSTGFNITAELDTGIVGTGAFGRSFGNFRAEGELSYSTNDVSTVSALGVSLGASGDISTVGFMVNGYYDFDTNSKWKPYIGGGIGGANVSLNNVSVVGVPLADDDTTVFAYQAKVGVAYEFSPAWEGTLGYRFFGTEDADFVDTDGDPFSTDGIQAHIVEVGFRFRF
ncbi:MAG: outer membrane beta-barrel protein [Gammaproteobacteria bacterium]|jgi:opacity protein-like surface antigen|nr:outer membrane beta-barrel protein [Gammaproteobacteria bacterium]